MFVFLLSQPLELEEKHPLPIDGNFLRYDDIAKNDRLDVIYDDENSITSNETRIPLAFFSIYNVENKISAPSVDALEKDEKSVTKGSRIFSPHQINNNPILYRIFLPPDAAKTKATLIRVYGGVGEIPYPTTTNIDRILAHNGIAIVHLKLRDVIVPFRYPKNYENKKFAGKIKYQSSISRDERKILLDEIAYFVNEMKNITLDDEKPEIAKKLNEASHAPFFLTGFSFGGEITFGCAVDKECSESFNGFIPEATYTQAFTEDDIKKLKKPMFITAHAQDKTVYPSNTLDLLKKAENAHKRDLLRFFGFKDVGHERGNNRKIDSEHWGSQLDNLAYLIYQFIDDVIKNKFRLESAYAITPHAPFRRTTEEYREKNIEHEYYKLPEKKLDFYKKDDMFRYIYNNYDLDEFDAEKGRKYVLKSYLEILKNKLWEKRDLLNTDRNTLEENVLNRIFITYPAERVAAKKEIGIFLNRFFNVENLMNKKEEKLPYISIDILRALVDEISQPKYFTKYLYEYIKDNRAELPEEYLKLQKFFFERLGSTENLNNINHYLFKNEAISRFIENIKNNEKPTITADDFKDEYKENASQENLTKEVEQYNNMPDFSNFIMEILYDYSEEKRVRNAFEWFFFINNDITESLWQKLFFTNIELMALQYLKLEPQLDKKQSSKKVFQELVKFGYKRETGKNLSLNSPKQEISQQLTEPYS